MLGLRRVLAVCFLVLSACVPAQAAVYTGVWDPVYGAPFTNLGWRGTATFYVPDDCMSAGTVTLSNLSDCGGLAVVTAAQVELYDATGGGQGSLLSTLVFDVDTLTIDQLRYDRGALTGLTSTLSDFLVPAEDLFDYGVGAFGSGNAFALQFTLAGPRLAWGNCAEGYCGGAEGYNDRDQFPPSFVITEVPRQVPEPMTLALAVMALVALMVVGTARQRVRRR